MLNQLHLATGIVAGRAWSDQDRALQRSVELARQAERRQRKQKRRHKR